MRVITGLARGHKLMTPEGVNTRPTTDRIKETLFNILAPYVMDSDFLDLFSGSGAIGIEALSRGARKAVFVEKDPKALAALKWNLSHTKLEQKAEVRPGNVQRVLEEPGREGAQFELIYLDPPYHEGYYEPVLRQIKEEKLLKKGGFIVAEQKGHTSIAPVEGLRIFRVKDCKNTILSFLALEEWIDNTSDLPW